MMIYQLAIAKTAAPSNTSNKNHHQPAHSSSYGFYTSNWQAATKLKNTSIYSL